MTSTLLPPLRRVAISTFEDLALLLREPAPDPEAPPPPFSHAARVVFAGPRCGYVDLRASEGVVAAAARNMLADDGAAPDLYFDALAELANVICGNLVPSLAAPDDIYRLEAPAAVALAPAPETETRVELGVEGGRVEVRLVLEPTPTAVPA